MTKCAFIPNFFRFYNIMWRAALPFLRRNRRLSSTLDQRLNPAAFSRADVWVQAASAGEALLAVSILRQMCPREKTRFLITTTTTQGMEILEQGLFPDSNAASVNNQITLNLAYFPFDLPDVVAEVIEQVCPRVMILLETEIWPALFFQLKQARIPTLILNARMSRKSFRHYRFTRLLWSALSPERILAISDPDAQRYASIFPGARVSTMPNIKFDALAESPDQVQSGRTSSFAALFPQNIKLSILASLRRQEEKVALQMIVLLLAQYPDQIIALFPRHMHRINAWKRLLKKNGFRFVLRSELEAGSETSLGKGHIVLWDQFGEMRSAFGLASAVFVGGSLKPLGGQNFIEPVIQGVPTVIGPFWDDFSWVGQSIFDQNIVLKTKDWQDAARTMVFLLKNPPDQAKLKASATEYISSCRGGTDMACQTILETLENLRS